jgi:major membrane immunogen (membrane-anchored lipoprotein)
MKKIATLFTVFLLTVICLASCSKKDNSKEPENPAKFLSAASFASSTWEGDNGVGTVTLKVTSTTDMTLTYFKMPSLSKNTDPVAQNVKITYTFTEADGKFSGQGDDGVNYSGELQSTTTMKFNGLSTGSLTLTKK